MDNPLVTVVIPCFNAERWIRQAIESVLNQSYPKIEVVVVDDGSTDGSLDVVRSFGDSVICTTGPNQGPSAARNRGLKMARGEWIQFLDADDLLHPLKIDLSLACCAGNPEVNFVWALPYSFEGESLPAPLTRVDVDFSQLKKSISLNVLDAHYAPAVAMFRANFLRRVGDWNETITRWEDLEYHARIAAMAGFYMRLEIPLYFYRQHDGTRLSDSNRNHSNLDQASHTLMRVREVFEASNIDQLEWKNCLFPFHLQLARSAAIMGESALFRYYLQEAAGLRPTIRFRAKQLAATICSYLIGISLTSRLIESSLGSGEKTTIT